MESSPPRPFAFFHYLPLKSHYCWLREETPLSDLKKEEKKQTCSLLCFYYVKTLFNIYHQDTVFTYIIGNLLFRDALVYNNGKSIVSTLTGSVWASYDNVHGKRPTSIKKLKSSFWSHDYGTNANFSIMLAVNILNFFKALFLYFIFIFFFNTMNNKITSGSVSSQHDIQRLQRGEKCFVVKC